MAQESRIDSNCNLMQRCGNKEGTAEALRVVFYLSMDFVSRGDYQHPGWKVAIGTTNSGSHGQHCRCMNLTGDYYIAAPLCSCSLFLISYTKQLCKTHSVNQETNPQTRTETTWWHSSSQRLLSEFITEMGESWSFWDASSGSRLGLLSPGNTVHLPSIYSLPTLTCPPQLDLQIPMLMSTSSKGLN